MQREAAPHAALTRGRQEAARSPESTNAASPLWVLRAKSDRPRPVHRRRRGRRDGRWQRGGGEHFATVKGGVEGALLERGGGALDGVREARVEMEGGAVA